MLDTLLLGKILQKDAEREYVPTVPQKIFQNMPSKTSKKHLPKPPKKQCQTKCPKNTLQKALQKNHPENISRKTSKRSPKA